MIYVCIDVSLFCFFFWIILIFRLRFAYSIEFRHDVYSMLARLHILFHRIMNSEPVFLFSSLSIPIVSHFSGLFHSALDIFFSLLPNSSFSFDSIHKMFALYSITIDKCLYALHIMLSHTLPSINSSYFLHLHTHQPNEGEIELEIWIQSHNKSYLTFDKFLEFKIVLYFCSSANKRDEKWINFVK